MVFSFVDNSRIKLLQKEGGSPHGHYFRSSIRSHHARILLILTSHTVGSRKADYRAQSLQMSSAMQSEARDLLRLETFKVVRTDYLPNDANVLTG